MVFPVVMYGCESWTIKKAECQRTDDFKWWCWRRLLRVPWTARRWNQSILWKSTLNIHWKDWCWSYNTFATWFKEPTHWKSPWCWERLRAGGEGGWQDEMVRWHHLLSGHEFEQTPGVSEGQGSLACCSLWGRKELDTSEWLKNNSNNNVLTLVKLSWY